jgi:hypothetical protein
VISAESAIRTMRRDLTVASLVKGVLVAAALGCALAGPMVVGGWTPTLAIVAIGAIWVGLGYRSARRSSLAADSPLLIASGQFDEAERQIEAVLRGFSIFRNVKLMSLHQLTVLRHAQHRWQESALLSRALLRQRLGNLGGVARSSRLMLADSLLEMGDLQGAHETILELYRQQLPLSEAMNLLLVQLDYESRIGAWEAMMRGVVTKMQLAELMPAAAAAKAQALLALAARRSGREDWAEWLGKRAALLGDVQEMVKDRGELGEVLGKSP